MRYELSPLTTDLFKKNLISKIELAEFHAEERALELLYTHMQERDRKKQELVLLNLEILKAKTDEMEKLNTKLLELKRKHIENQQKQEFILKMKKNLSFMHGELCQELLGNYGQMLSLEIRRELLALELREE